MAELIAISQAKKMRNGINVKATVKSKGEPRSVKLRSGGETNVCDAIIKDGDGPDNEMKLTLWGDDIKLVNAGDTVVITNGYTNSFRNEVSLTKGKYGEMAVNPQ